MNKIGALQLRNLDVLDSSFVHSEEGYTRQCCLVFDTKCAKEMCIECFNSGLCSSVQVEDAQLFASEAIQLREDTLVLQNFVKSLIGEIVEDEGK